LLQEWLRESTEQFNVKTVWQRACDYIKQSFYNNKHPPTPHLTKYHAN